MAKQRQSITALLMTLALAFASGISAQTQLTKDMAAFQSGVFPRRTLNYFTAGERGKNCIWDFSKLKINKTEQIVRQRLDTLGYLSVTDDRQITYYGMSNDSLFEIGIESPLTRTFYHEPICQAVLPMALGDSISTPFVGFGIYCNDHYYKESGVNNVVTDGFGCIVLAEGDTLRNVLRVYKYRSYFVAMSTDPNKLDSARLKQVIEERYEWYVKGMAKPVFETLTSTSYDNLTPLGTTQLAYCALPAGVQAVIDEQRRTKPSETNADTSIVAQDILHYTVNVGEGVATINYALDKRANITMLLCDNMGMVYGSKRFVQEAGEGYESQFDLRSLRQGVYILYINVNGKVYSEKVRK